MSSCARPRSASASAISAEDLLRRYTMIYVSAIYMDIPIYDGLRAAMARVSKDFRNLPYGMHIMAGAR